VNERCGKSGKLPARPIAARSISTGAHGSNDDRDPSPVSIFERLLSNDGRRLDRLVLFGADHSNVGGVAGVANSLAGTRGGLSKIPLYIADQPVSCSGAFPFFTRHSIVVVRFLWICL
jgi:hypothetical protein